MATVFFSQHHLVANLRLLVAVALISLFCAVHAGKPIPQNAAFVISAKQYSEARAAKLRSPSCRNVKIRTQMACFTTTTTLSTALDKDFSISPSPGSGKFNTRYMMNIIIARYSQSSRDRTSDKDVNDNNTNSDNADSSSWSKTRKYLYQASDRLTIDQVEAVLTFLDDMFPENINLIKSILQSSPRILRKNPVVLAGTATFLQELYGLDLFQEAITRNPSLLIASGVSHDRRNEDLEYFLINDLRLKSSIVSKLKKSTLFSISSENVKSVVMFLQGILKNGGYSTVESQRRILGRVLTSHPHLMNLSVKANLQPRIQFVMDRCGLKEGDMALLIKSSPGVLGLSVDGNLRPTIEFLSTLLYDSSATAENEIVDKLLLRKCLMAHPQLLALSLKNLRTKVAYFDAIDELDHRSTESVPSLASRIAVRSPVVYSLSLKENIVPKVNFLAKTWGTTAPNVLWLETNNKFLVVEHKREALEVAEPLSKRLKDYPNVLTLSLEGNIQPTLRFFSRTGYISLAKESTLREEDGVRNIPGRYIASSLFNRLLPRWHFYLLKCRVDRTPRVNGKIIVKPPLHILVGATDASFCEHQGYALHEFQDFTKESAPRLKFSSQWDTWLKTGRPIDDV